MDTSNGMTSASARLNAKSATVQKKRKTSAIVSLFLGRLGKRNNKC